MSPSYIPYFVVPAAKYRRAQILAMWPLAFVCASGFWLTIFDAFGYGHAMTHAQAKLRHAELAEEIRGHDEAYYVRAQPSISDQEYDRLYRELFGFVRGLFYFCFSP